MTEDDIRSRFNIAVPCCLSCHEDGDHGYLMSCIVVDGEEVDVCCTVANSFHLRKDRVIESAKRMAAIHKEALEKLEDS